MYVALIDADGDVGHISIPDVQHAGAVITNAGSTPDASRTGSGEVASASGGDNNNNNNSDHASVAARGAAESNAPIAEAAGSGDDDDDDSARRLRGAEVESEVGLKDGMCGSAVGGGLDPPGAEGGGGDAEMVRVTAGIAQDVTAKLQQVVSWR